MPGSYILEFIKMSLSLKNYKLTLLCLVVLILLTPILLFFLPLTNSIPINITALGLIFTAMKHETDLLYLKEQQILNEKEFELKLFTDRFQIFKQINDTVWKVLADLKVSRTDIEQLSGNLLFQSYYLFSRETYLFIKEIRQNLIELRTFSTSNKDKDINRCKEIVFYLTNLMDNENLLKMFPEIELCK